MSSTGLKSRPRARARRHFTLWAESLEARRLLVASPTNVASSLAIASVVPVPDPGTDIGLSTPAGTTPIFISMDLTFTDDLPVPGLENGIGLPVVGYDTGIGLATPSQTLSENPLIVSPLPSGSTMAATAAVPMATGPSTTLNPLGSDSQTASAAASEVARPTPGRSDRISNFIPTRPIVPLPHLRSPGSDDIPGPRARPRQPDRVPAAPAKPPALQVEPPAKPVAPVEPAVPAIPARPIDAGEAPAPRAAPAGPQGPMTFRAWDAAIDLMAADLTGHARDTAIDLVASDLAEDSRAEPASRAEGAIAVGALMAAWGGWKFGSRPQGRSRRRPSSMFALEAGPGDGSAR